MVNHIARDFLTDTGYAVSAVVWMDQAGNIDRIHLFDTYFRVDCLENSSPTEKIWLISNHPEGRQEPYAEDMENLVRLKARYAQAEISLFVASEYFPCRQITLC